jgi:hypothetical protein
MHFNRSGHNFCHASDKIRCAPIAGEEQGAIEGSGLNAGSIGAEIDVIKPALPAQTHAEGASQETQARLPALQEHLAISPIPLLSFAAP